MQGIQTIARTLSSHLSSGVGVAGVLAVMLLGTSPMERAVSAGASAPAQNLLLGAQDLTYVGAFRVPPQADLNYDHSGHGLAFDPQRQSLFVSNYASRLSEITIPTPGTSGTAAALPQATLLQGPTDVLRGRLSQAGDMIGGVLVDGSDLIVSAYVLYDVGGVAYRSHFRVPKDFTQLTVAGPARVGGTNPGWVAGPMIRIPQAWQALLGGPALTGQCCISIISRSSYGPSASVFNPADLSASAAQVPATPVLGYTQTNPTLGDWDSSGTLWNNATAIAGMAWIEGTNSLLYFGRYGSNFCYGAAAACNDPTSNHKGDHAYPYEYAVWAYDASDLVKVKNGQLQKWEVTPYATWTFAMPLATPGRTLRGVAYDPATQRVFLAEQKAHRSEVLVRVLQANANPVPGGFTASPPSWPATPSSPTPSSPAPVPPAAPPPPTPSPPPGGCTTPDPFVVLGGGSCFGGNWYPPGMAIPGMPVPTTGPGAAPPTAPPTPVTPSGCQTADPFAVLGGGTCSNGNWYPPGMEIPDRAGAPAPVVPSAPAPSPAPAVSPTPAGCVTPDPFNGIPGLVGRCVGGNWLPFQYLAENGVVSPRVASDGTTVWGIIAGSQFFEIAGGLAQGMRVIGLRVNFEGILRPDVDAILRDSLVAELLRISSR